MRADGGGLGAGSCRRAVIMAGGRGTRLAPYTSVLPKPLMPVDGQPILEVVLRQLKAHGFERVTVCLGYLAELIANFFGDGSKLGLSLDYCVEDAPMGTAGPLARIGAFDEPLLVMNADVLTTLDFSDLYRRHVEHGGLFTVASRRQEVPVPYGVVEFGDQHRMTRFEEKPNLGYWCSMGIYVVSPGIRRFLPADGPFGMDELMKRLMADGRPPLVFPFEGNWLDVAKPEDCCRAGEFVQAHREHLLG